MSIRKPAKSFTVGGFRTTLKRSHTNISHGPEPGLQKLPSIPATQAIQQTQKLSLAPMPWAKKLPCGGLNGRFCKFAPQQIG